MDKMIPDVALKQNKVERLPCVLIVDGSTSMKESGAIASLNEGLQQLANDLKADDDTADGVQIAILRMGGDVVELTGFVDASEFNPPTVIANGSTPLGKAVDRAMSMIDEQKQRYRENGVSYKRPWLWIMSDGQPTDAWQPVAARARTAQEAKQFTLWAIGIGKDAPLEALISFTNGERCFRIGERDFKAMFEWMSASMSAGSKTGAGQQMALPPRPKEVEGM
jgi:uncharacterized protein YegL